MVVVEGAKARRTTPTTKDAQRAAIGQLSSSDARKGSMTCISILDTVLSWGTVRRKKEAKEDEMLSGKRRYDGGPCSKGSGGLRDGESKRGATRRSRRVSLCSGAEQGFGMVRLRGGRWR